MQKMIAAVSTTSGSPGTNEMIVARVPQGYDTNINIRFVPGRDIQWTPHALGCRPRQGAPRRDAEPVALPESLAEKLKGANKKVIDWLAQDAANAQLFLARPVEALIKAGVDLSRSEQKALDRTHRAVGEASVIAPGVKVANLSASAYPTGRVGTLKPGPKMKDGRTNDCGCGPKGKE
ncbi:MAG TPA: hypothetical protein VGG03_26835 [Thermoanaerobaculia bacterium]|jgi:hypothetical protein